MKYEKSLDTPVQYLKGVGPKLAKLFAKLGVSNIEDLLYFFPRDYEDRTRIQPIAALLPSPFEIIKAEITEVKLKKSVITAVLSDRSGSITAVWFNQPFLAKLLRSGMRLILSGKVDYDPYSRNLQILVKDFEIDTGNNPVIAPIYPLTAGLYPKKIRSVIETAISEYASLLVDLVPESIKTEYRLCDLRESITNLHFPKNLADVEKYRRRLVFDDFFFFQLGLGMRRKAVKAEKGIAFKLDVLPLQLPFELTNGQKRVLKEIEEDMRSDKPMNRLIQGDVGSGKTIIAAIAAHTAIANGYQAALMAPTEILANQHFIKISAYLKDCKIKLVTGTTQRKDPSTLLGVDMVIGTHALIEEKIKFKKLGLVVIDEQHRFGVLQRANLSRKGTKPDLLFLTATPIPRSLALTLYGDLDRSIIDELPPGRTPVKTHYVPAKKRNNAYEFMRREVGGGRQVFIVCPLVEESEKIDLKAAMDEREILANQVFPEFRVGLLHGRMKGEEKERIMNDFKNNKIQILVSTTVIEVGIDIPNASIMVVEHADRFGLSQLHQLRGRIGRGAHQSYCLLFSDPKSPEAKTRIKAMLDSNDGFYIAEVDLKLRGPGDFAGIRQSGLPNFRIADIVRDEVVLQEARKAASKAVMSDPLKQELLRRFGKFLGY